MQIMEPARVVVTIQTIVRVIRVTQVQLTPHKAKPMYLPSQAPPESLLPTQIRNREIDGKSLLPSAFLPMKHKPEEHTISLWPMAEHIDSRLKGIGRKPVIGINHRDELTPRLPKSYVTSHALSLIGGLAKHSQTRIAGLPPLKNGERSIGGCIVNSQYFHTSKCLIPEQRSQCLIQIRRGIIDRHQNRNNRRSHQQPNLFRIFCTIGTEGESILQENSSEATRQSPLMTNFHTEGANRQANNVMPSKKA